MKKIFLFLLFVLNCFQSENHSHIKVNSDNTLSPVSKELASFHQKIQILSHPKSESYLQLFKIITDLCRFDLSDRGEFMGYPQFIFQNQSIKCIWNQNKEIISFEGFDSNENLGMKSYWYLGYPTMIEKVNKKVGSVMVNWVWIQNHRVTKPTIQRISINLMKENQSLDYLFNPFSGQLESKEEWILIKNKKLVNNWQLKIDGGKLECSYYEKGEVRSSKKECNLWNYLLDEINIFSIN